MQNLKSAGTTLVVALVAVLWGCSSSQEIRNTGDIDDSWSGMWYGRLLIENSFMPPRKVELEIEFTSTHIRAFYTDSSEAVYRQKVSRLQLEEDGIKFQVAYDTRRGLRALLEFDGRRTGRYVMAEFWGSEGGRPFRGKWEARQAERVVQPISTKPASTRTEGGDD